MSKFVCDHPWTHFEVNNPNGDVTMCCDNQTVLGNVNDASVEEIWNNEKFQAIRREMKDLGAHKICPPSCPVLNGFKTYQDLSWYTDMDASSTARLNAEKNEQELKDGALVLTSMPRWMRFAYSYKCNLDCYHCYQREDAVQNTKLPDSFIDEVYKLAPTYQVLYFFGGEPFLYKPVIKMMKDIQTDKDCRYLCITNATLLNDQIMATLEASNIGHFAVSLDAGTEGSFGFLRKKDANTSWQEVLENIRKIADLKRKKGFSFTISMTLNTINYDEIEAFTDLCLSFDAEPLVMLVSNPYERYEFQKTYLHFSDAQFDEIEKQIGSSLIKMRDYQYREAEKALVSLRRAIEDHRNGNNNLTYFGIKQKLRFIYEPLPSSVKATVRTIVVRPLRWIANMIETSNSGNNADVSKVP